MNFTEILTRSRNPDDTIRNNAEVEIDRLATQDFPWLMMECAKVLQEEKDLKENRLLCATIIKNMILFSENHRGKWEQINPDVKLEIKRCVLASLASNVKEVRKGAGITIAGKLIFNFRDMQTGDPTWRMARNHRYSD